MKLQTLSLFYLRAMWYRARTHAHRRLSEAFDHAQQVSFDDTSRFVFFSDCHRGTNGGMDTFARNEDLFMHALQHYYRRGFSYVEVGDGDELWQNRRFSDVRCAHGRVFDLLHLFERRGRLHLLVGNHDIGGRRRDQVVKDGIVAHEALVLRHAKSGQQILSVHGHQVDFKSDRLYVVSRLVVQAWKQVQLLGMRHLIPPPQEFRKPTYLDRRVVEWARARRQIVIGGHTHRARFAAPGTPPYFNAGSCVIPGAITCLEVLNGTIALIRWSLQNGTGRSGTPHVRRELVAPPRALCAVL